MIKAICVFATASLLLALSGPVTAGEKSQPPMPPQVWQDLVKCREIADPATRLSCYDTQAGKAQQAADSGDLVLADRKTMHETRKGLFGFKLPTLGLFGGGKGDPDEMDAIDDTIGSAQRFGYGSWRLTLADGSVWEQVDDTRLLFDPRSGNKVHIYKGAMGTFRANIDGQRAIKVRRVE